jgi:hypothetical protein
MTHRPTRSLFAKPSLALMLCGAALTAIAGCASSSEKTGFDSATPPREPAPAPASARESTKTLIKTDSAATRPPGTKAQSVPDRIEELAAPAGGYNPGDLIKFSFSTTGGSGDLPVSLELKLSGENGARLPVVFLESCAKLVAGGSKSVLTVPISADASPTGSKPIKYMAYLSGAGTTVKFEGTLAIATPPGPVPPSDGRK